MNIGFFPFYFTLTYSIVMIHIFVFFLGCQGSTMKMKIQLLAGERRKGKYKKGFRDKGFLRNRCLQVQKDSLGVEHFPSCL